MRDGNVIETYFSEIRKFKPLKKSEEVELTNRIKCGDESAKKKLIESNLKFVVSIAKKYCNDDIPFEDIISEGNLGLIRAAEKYDASVGNKFITYAVWWIKAYINNYIDGCNRFRDADNEFTKVSYTDDGYEYDYDFEYERELVDINDEFDRHMMDAKYKDDAIEEIMSSLENRERRILELYFGLDGEKSLTLNEIGAEMNLSGERVRQIMDKAIVKLKCGALMNDELMAMAEID